MSQATELIAKQMAAGAANARVWADILYNAKAYGAKGDGTTDDTAAINSAILAASVNGGTVYLPVGRYKFTRIISEDNVHLSGEKPSWNGTSLVKGTVIVGNITITGSSATLSGLGFENTSGNGVYVTGDSSKINISNCNFSVQNHAVLLEQNGGTCNTIEVKDCEAYNGIHGFVSKAKNVRFTRCKSYSCSSTGFALISDNINGSGKNSICENNIIDNCVASATNVGFSSYSRDYTSTTNTAGIALNNLSFSQCTAKDTVAYGFQLGDEVATPGGNTYNDVQNVSIANCITSNTPNGSIKFGRVNKVAVTGSDIGNAMSKTTYAKNIKLGKNNYALGPGDAIYNTTLPAGSAPTLLNGDTFYVLNNASYTEVYNFANAEAGQVIVVRINDNNTTIKKNASIDIEYDVKGIGSVVVLRLSFDGSKWEQILIKSRALNSHYNYAADITVDWSKGKISTMFLTGNVNSITFSGATPNGAILVMSLWGDAARTITTWDPNIKWGTKPSALTINKKCMMTFYYDGTNYHQISYQLTDL